MLLINTKLAAAVNPLNNKNMQITQSKKLKTAEVVNLLHNNFLIWVFQVIFVQSSNQGGDGQKPIRVGQHQ